jgi:cytoskeletal protein CcmA (bactofilin family)
MGTVIGEGLVIEGDVASREDVIVYGTVRGKLQTSEQLTVGNGGLVEADVSAQAVSISGQVTGDVVAVDRVDIQPGGRLVGDVQSARLTIADGASFKGNVDMQM